jgi:hypothetical protein
VIWHTWFDPFEAHLFEIGFVFAGETPEGTRVYDGGDVVCSVKGRPGGTITTMEMERACNEAGIEPPTNIDQFFGD